jgi:hypothetical protein
MFLRNGVCPSRPQWLEHKPSLREFATLNPISLDSCAATSLTGFRISPFERKTEPCPVAMECVVVNDDSDAGPVLPHLGKLRRVSPACYRPVTLFVVPDEVWTDAGGDQIVLSLVPNKLPSVEQVTH